MPVPSQFPPGQLLLCFSRVYELDRESELTLLGQFSSSEHKRLDSIKSPARRLEYLCSRLMMRHALNHYFDDRKIWQFEEKSGHSPQVSNLPSGVHLNLSHSKGIICFAIADMPVGVDIEACEQRQDFAALGKMFMNDSERTTLAELSDPMAYFYRCWCVKEAWYKAHTAAEQEDLHFTGIAIDEISQSHNHWHLTEGLIGNHYLVAASEKTPSQIHCHYFPDEESWKESFKLVGS